MIKIPPNIVLAQFIEVGVTGFARGQTQKNMIGIRNSSAAILMYSPNFPSDHRRGGKGGPRIRRWTTQAIVTKYDASTAMLPSEFIALRATVEPRLMHERRAVTRRETNTALRGIFQPGET
jgi:hypothetical protein